MNRVSAYGSPEYVKYLREKTAEVERLRAEVERLRAAAYQSALRIADALAAMADEIREDVEAARQALEEK
jgi:hypothetical protein